MSEHVNIPLLFGGFVLLLQGAAARARVWAPVVSRVRGLIKRDRPVAALGLCAGALAAETIAITALAWVAAAVAVKVFGL